MKRLLCLLFGHRPGAALHRYARTSREIAQRPDLRGRLGFVETGYRCARCQKDVEK